MIYEMPVSTEEVQDQTCVIFDSTYRLVLYYNEITQGWQFDLTDMIASQLIVQRMGLAVNSPALIETNLPFVLVLVDTSEYGINSIGRSELGQRIKLYAVSKEDWHEAIWPPA